LGHGTDSHAVVYPAVGEGVIPVDVRSLESDHVLELCGELRALVEVCGTPCVVTSAAVLPEELVVLIQNSVDWVFELRTPAIVAEVRAWLRLELEGELAQSSTLLGLGRCVVRFLGL
jgi:hypothetical protein